jgi:hypothetical protein
MCTEWRGSIGLMDSSLKSLFPLIVPAEYVQSGAWKLPHVRLNFSDLILTWVLLHEEQTMLYVTMEHVNNWKRHDIEWGLIAIENMKRDTGKNPATHEKRDASGNLLWIAMMQSDGLGSSRVLMTENFTACFPEATFWQFQSGASEWPFQQKLRLRTEPRSLKLSRTVTELVRQRC